MEEAGPVQCVTEFIKVTVLHREYGFNLNIALDGTRCQCVDRF